MRGGTVLAAGATSVQLTARKILDAIDRASTIPTTGSVTKTVGAAFANSTVLTSAASTAPSIVPTDARIRSIGCALSKFTNNYYYNRSAAATAAYAGVTPGLVDGGNGWGQSFWFDGQAFDVSLMEQPNTRLRLKVNGAWCNSGTDYTLANSDYNNYYEKFDFGSRAQRLVELYFCQNTVFYGYNIGAEDSIWLPETRVTGMMFGDSYCIGVNQANIKATLPHLIGQGLGIVNFHHSGVGGEGFVAVDSNSSYNFGNRIAGGDLTRFGLLDLVVMYASVNDWNSTLSTIQANIISGLNAALAAQPNAIVVFLVGFYAPGSAVSGTTMAGELSAAQSISNPRLVVVDLRGMLTGTGNTNSPAGNGNADYYWGSSDTTHPNPAGWAYLAQRCVSGIVGGLTAIS